MNFELIINEFHLAEHVLAVILGTPRIFMIIQTVPFMGSTILTGQLRVTVALACYMILHPAVLASLPQQSLSETLNGGALYGALILKESLIGMLIGIMSGILFWSVQSAGFFIDNQRGASQASGSDPLSGEQTSPLGSFLFQAIVYVFFASGSFMVFLQLIYTSYEFWPITSLIPMNIFTNANFPLFFAEQVSYLMLLTILLSGPIVMACLLTDISLGLMNRFASQLNVYVLAMPIKSAVAAFLLIFYFGMLLNEVRPMFNDIITTIHRMRDMT